MKEIKKSDKLANIFYEIRGPVLDEASRMEDEGQRILKLNIGNPKPFGFDAPDEIIQDVIKNLPHSEGYSESKGIYSARKAVMQYYQQQRVHNVEVDDVYLGNGASELIHLACTAIVNTGDEVLVPAPDYPLWTGAVTLGGGKAVHYRCDEQADWFPDIEDIKAKINSRTRAIVVINPNNPTGAVYSKALLLEIVELARQHDLIILADEIYDKILYDGAVHHCLAALSHDVLTLTFNGLSKAYRLCGWRSGWMLISGPKHMAKDLIQGFNMLSSMRLCPNVPAQYAIQTSLGGYQTINDLTAPGGRMYEQRNQSVAAINAIPGLSVVNPKGALYLFVKMDKRKFGLSNDEQMALDLLRQEKILVVHGRGFNYPDVDHFRMVFLPPKDVLMEATERMARFFSAYRQD
ncbi:MULTISPECIES: pyridoxal phosphate-dependent aminotransferase [Reinekea]|jgi:alanine-synthesizing transaminase|uniref:Glutamate-pyruvate aminotransferase AlaA n=1 Tax=Reinekea forsetii TaxID=1336806 RepID=A0A2K8KNG8_9GAMM|nr:MULTISPECIES: pyridoxal phosphate-dependent aminotransferase [Reinekea]ATX76212.1 aminotransferase AlaT [Reinekea forsetii]